MRVKVIRKREYVELKCPLCNKVHSASIYDDGEKFTISTYCPFTNSRLFHYSTDKKDFSRIFEFRETPYLR